MLHMVVYEQQFLMYVPERHAVLGGVSNLLYTCFEAHRAQGDRYLPDSCFLGERVSCKH